MVPSKTWGSLLSPGALGRMHFLAAVGIVDFQDHKEIASLTLGLILKVPFIWSGLPHIASFWLTRRVTNRKRLIRGNLRVCWDRVPRTSNTEYKHPGSTLFWELYELIQGKWFPARSQIWTQLRQTLHTFSSVSFAPFETLGPHSGFKLPV